MPTTATPTSRAAGPIEDMLRTRPDGMTARKLASLTNLGLRQVNETLATMETAGTATRTPGEANGNGRKGADNWKLTTPEATDEPTAASGPDTTDDTPTVTDEAPADDDTSDRDDTPAEAPVSAVPVSGAPTSGAPTGTPDLKIVMVAGVLGDHPDGVSAADVVNESGLRSAIVARALAAMEAAGAAVRTSATEPGGVELWTRGEADLVGISLVTGPTFVECPTCGHRKRVSTTVATGRVSTAPGQNADGSRVLGKNELREMVGDFLASHPTHEFTAGVISREIGRSSGAISNALAKLVIAGEAALTREAPMTYTTTPTALRRREALANEGGEAPAGQ